LSEERFLDEGRSAYSGEHVGDKGQLRRFIDLVKAGNIARGSYLVVESLDRLGRQDVWSAFALLNDLMSMGIKIVTLVDGRILAKGEISDGDIFMSLGAILRAHDESLHKSKRALDVWHNKKLVNARKTKAPVGKQVAKWLALVDEKYVLREDRAAVIRRIFEWCILGRGAVWISKKLNHEGIPAFRSGGTWSTASVLQLLKNRRVLGEWEPADGKGKIEGYFPTVIDNDTWNRAQLAMNLRRRTITTKQTYNFQVWQGIAKCGSCGATMHLSNKDQYRYLACSNRRKGLCIAKPIRYDEAERVFRELMAQVGSISMVQTNSASVMAQLDTMKAEKLAAQQQLDRYEEAVRSELASNMVFRLIQETEQKIEELRAKQEELELLLARETVNENDKEWFLERLELTAFDGRSRANDFLRRLDITVSASRGHYLALQGERPILYLTVSDEKIACMPLTANQAKRLQAYGDRSLDALLGTMPESASVNAETYDAAVAQFAEGIGRAMATYLESSAGEDDLKP
jgi:DNA invertase Pin-like site-specific DNA recombinase